MRVLQGIVPQLTGGGLSGDVIVLGRDATRTRPYELAAAGVTIAYQNALEGFVADRVDDEVAFGPECLELAPDEVAARVAEALAAVGLTHAASRRIATLSGGEQQRVAIAAALAIRPRLLLLDEPTAHLDETTAAEIVALLDRVRREAGIALVLAEHRLGLVAPLADRIAVIARGRVAALGPPREVLRDPALAPLGVPVPRATSVAVRLGIASTPLTPAELADALASRAPTTRMDAVTRGDATETLSTPRTPSLDRDGVPRGAGALGGIAAHASPPSLSSSRSSLALRFERVAYRYPGADRDALRDVSLEIARGERVALVGRSGAGKSTLARLALGLARPSAGAVEVLGVRTPTTATLAPRVGLVVQNPMHQLLAERVDDEVALGLRGLPAAERRARVGTMLERFGLDALAARHPLSLSEGQRRRLALAAAIAPAPELLVLDEPTLAQDEIQRVALAALVRELAGGGVAVLAITHDREFANDACDRVLALADGALVADLAFAAEPDGIAGLARAGVPLADVPATVLGLWRRSVTVAARTVDGLVDWYA